MTMNVNTPSLDDILSQLEDCGLEAVEKGYAVPFPAAYKSANKIIREIYENYPSDIGVIPNKYGSLLMDIPVWNIEPSAWFMIYCNSSGDVAVEFTFSSEEKEVKGIFDDDTKIGAFFVVFLEHLRNECEICEKGGKHNEDSNN